MDFCKSTTDGVKSHLGIIDLVIRKRFLCLRLHEVATFYCLKSHSESIARCYFRL